MEAMEILKYIGMGVAGIIGFCIALAIIGGILHLIFDIIVCIVIAPFYILFHPVLFITKPRICLKNIIAKAPCYGDDFVPSKAKINPQIVNLDDDDEEDNIFIKEYKYFEEQEQISRLLSGKGLFGGK
ncbi:hypothetical protein [Megamonas hypermegale]|uniref:hypothetical protein n=1 Tax=Megamonas hypermegale TaxID=158847 RepID=UPI00320A2048